MGIMNALVQDDEEVPQADVHYWGFSISQHDHLKRHVERDIAAGKKVEMHDHGIGGKCGAGCMGYAKFYG